ncbi:MAG: 3-deoxy-manno-octulosonate cytidylyltransferase [Granulosicoccus sp.]|nr:3-deoxy-manno-octulosonate cytidylyltransferase [Granulosicoccus sp.]
MAEPEFHIVIPARFDSTRFPGKPLFVIAGKAMIEHVHDRALETSASSVLVATDDQRIVDHCKSRKIPVTMTDPDHASGTDRIGEVVEQQQWTDEEIVVCLQGDEPATPAVIVDQVAKNLSLHDDAAIATLCARITEQAEYLDRNRVKVVFDNNGYALYFSRASIPQRRDDTDGSSDFPDAYVHIGLYAYRCGFLRQYQTLQPHPLELEEKLEQLRALANGYRIHIEPALDVPAHGVDAPSDVPLIEKILLSRG